MATFIGFYTPNPDWARETSAKYRSGELQPGQLAEPVATKARELLQKLPATIKVIGSYGPVGQSADVPENLRRPGVTIVETDDAANLVWYNQYYAGYLAFSWHQYTPIARA